MRCPLISPALGLQLGIVGCAPQCLLDLASDPLQLIPGFIGATHRTLLPTLFPTKNHQCGYPFSSPMSRSRSSASADCGSAAHKYLRSRTDDRAMRVAGDIDRCARSGQNPLGGAGFGPPDTQLRIGRLVGPRRSIRPWAADEAIVLIVIDYNMSLAETAVAGMAGAPGRPEGAAPDGRRSGDRLRQRDAGRRGRAGVDGLPAAGRAWGRCEKCFRQTCFGPPQTAERRYGPRGTSRLTPHGPAGVRRPGIQRGRTRLSARRMCSRSF